MSRASGLTLLPGQPFVGPAPHDRWDARRSAAVLLSPPAWQALVTAFVSSSAKIWLDSPSDVLHNQTPTAVLDDADAIDTTAAAELDA